VPIEQLSVADAELVKAGDHIFQIFRSRAEIALGACRVVAGYESGGRQQL